MYFQQGDVLLKSVDSVPADAVEQEARGRGLVLAEGEVTGHYHAVPMAEVDEDIHMYEKDGVLYLSSSKDFTVEHDEHHTQTVPAGNYEVGIVQEFDHYAEEIQKVRD